LAAAEERDGDGDLLELEPLELDRELELEEVRDPEPLESEAESLERDFRRFFLVRLPWAEEEEEREGPRSSLEPWPFSGFPRTSALSPP
jgi:hypothetical protein